MLASLHDLLAHKRPTFFLSCLLLLLVCGLWTWRLRIGENAAAMLPHGGQVAADFALLQSAPFAQRLAVSLEDSGQIGADALTDTAATVAAALEALGPPLVVHAMAGPPRNAGPQVLDTFFMRLPSLATDQDLVRIQERLEPKAVKTALRRDLLLLQTPQSFAVERFVRQDPLDLRTLALEKLGAVRMLPRMRLHNGAFLSQDRRHALILVTTDVPITDVSGSEALLQSLETLLQVMLPKGVKPTLLSGHAYTRANAQAIKLDLKRILTLSCLGLGLLFGLMVRTWRVLFVLLVPGIAYLAGLSAVSLAYPVVSGITLGFGGVLMGISVDFALHVFMALRQEHGKPGVILGSVARPVAFSYLTTAAAFSIMLLSDLPGVRQLSVFSLAGLSCALLVSLIALPQLPLMSPPAKKHGETGHALFTWRWSPPKPRCIIVIWLAVLGLCCLAGRNLHLEGDMRELALMPEDLRSNEQDFKQIWGDVRGQAMVFAGGATFQKALEANQAVYDQLMLLLSKNAEPNADQNGVLSLAPLLPPESLQRKRHNEWRLLWERRLPLFEPLLRRQAQALGFSQDAFDPFFEYLRVEPRFMNAATLRQTGLGPLLDMLAKGSEDGFLTVTLLPDDDLLLQQTPTAWQEPGNPVRLVSQGRFRHAMEKALQRDFTRFLLLAGGIVLLLLLALFRRPGKILLALTPVLTALAALAGGMGLMGGAITVYGVLAAVLSMGLAVDYGIFMTMRAERGHSRSTSKAVLLSGCSTILGFGVLAAARHPALHGMGLAVLLGLAGALPAALFVVPALQEVFKK